MRLASWFLLSWPTCNEKIASFQLVHKNYMQSQTRKLTLNETAAICNTVWQLRLQASNLSSFPHRSKCFFFLITVFTTTILTACIHHLLAPTIFSNTDVPYSHQLSSLKLGINLSVSLLPSVVAPWSLLNSAQSSGNAVLNFWNVNWDS